MKKVTLCLVASIFLSVLSCSDDDSSPDLINVESDASEEVSLDPVDVSENISINGSTKVAGNPPAPNGAIAFSMPTSTQSGFQNNGFDISFDAPASYAGAYIQLKGENGDTAPEYFDVPYGPGKSLKRSKKNKLFKASEKVNENDITIDVDFNENVTAGTFCYIICIYDGQGNISDPVEVCVEVEAWGGNPNLVGTWQLEKFAYDGQFELPGEEECDDSTIFCNDQTELLIENAYCDKLTSLPLTFNADGTFEYIENGKYTNYDYDASIEACQPIFEPEKEDQYISRGKWAYDEEENKLTLVEFEFVEIYEGNTYEDSDPNGYLLFNGDAQITASSLIITETYEEAGFSETFEAYFRK